MYQRLLTINYWVRFEWVTQIINSLTDFSSPVLFAKIQNLIFPQRFFQPILRKAHCLYVNHGEICQQLFQMTFHIVMRWYYINEPFDDAYIKESPVLWYWRTNPCMCNFLGNRWSYGVLLIPNSCMMTTSVSGQSYNCYPWNKHRNRKIEICCYLFLNALLDKFS